MLSVEVEVGVGEVEVLDAQGGEIGERDAEERRLVLDVGHVLALVRRELDVEDALRAAVGAGGHLDGAHHAGSDGVGVDDVDVSAHELLVETALRRDLAGIGRVRAPSAAAALGAGGGRPAAVAIHVKAPSHHQVCMYVGR